MISGAGYLEEYTINEKEYIDTIMNYLNTFIIDQKGDDLNGKA